MFSTAQRSLDFRILWIIAMCTLLQARCRAVFLFSSSSVRSALARWRRIAGQQKSNYWYPDLIIIVRGGASIQTWVWQTAVWNELWEPDKSNRSKTYPQCRCVPCQQLPSEQSVHFCPLYWSLLHGEAPAEVPRHPQQMQQHAVGSYRHRQSNYCMTVVSASGAVVSFKYKTMGLHDWLFNKISNNHRCSQINPFCSAASPSFGISGVDHVDPSRFQQPLCSTAVAIHPTSKTAELIKWWFHQTYKLCWVFFR